jgi:tRNA(Ile)-lysidine synthase
MALPAAEPRISPLFDPRQLLQEPLLSTATAVVVALSGGLDSSVLLYLLASLRTQGLRAPLCALHVQHGLQDEAEAWLEHCRAECAALGVPLIHEHLHLGAAGLSSEDAARAGRYEAFAKHLPAGGVLLQAHHRQDQLETVLFRFLRGTGVRGLAGMPRERRFAQGWLLRPLLEVSRPALERYAQEHHLRWIEDPSNREAHYTRNFLRQRILPLLRERWQALDHQILESARRSAEAAELLDALAQTDLLAVQGPHPAMLRLAALSALSPARRNNLLRHWYRGVAGMGAPQLSSSLLDALQHDLLDAAPDASPELRWGEQGGEWSLRRHGAHLHLVSPLPMLPERMTLVAGEPLELPAPLGRLVWREKQGDGLALRKGDTLELRFRCGGERIKPVGRPTRELKKLLQELHIEPWLRDYVPLVYRGEELIAVADFAVAEVVAVDAGQNGLQLVWERADLHCRG